MKLLLSTLLLLTGCTEQTYKAGDCLSVHSREYDFSKEPWGGYATVRIEMVGKKEYLVKKWDEGFHRWATRETTISMQPETEYYERRPCPRKD